MADERSAPEGAGPTWKSRVAASWRARAPVRQRKLGLFLWATGGVAAVAIGFVALHPDDFFGGDHAAGQTAAADTGSAAASVTQETSAQPSLVAAHQDDAAKASSSAPASPALYCKDDTGKFQPFVHTDLARLDTGFRKAYGWSRFELPGGTGKDGAPYTVIAYARDHGSIGQEAALFPVQPYNGGLVLLGRLEKEPGKEPEASQGADMCGTLLVMLQSTAAADAGAGDADADEAGDRRGGPPQADAAPGGASQ